MDPNILIQTESLDGSDSVLEKVDKGELAKHHEESSADKWKTRRLLFILLFI
jgi:hypothetical protein